MKLYLQRNILLGFLFSMTVVLGLALTSYLYFNNMLESTKWAAHARRVLYHAEQVRSVAFEIETSHRGYGLTGDEQFLDSYPGAVTAIRNHLRELDSLTFDNPTQHKRVDTLQALIGSR